MSDKHKRLLTLDDLVAFCSSHDFTNFSAKDTGYSLSVQVPATFEEEKDDNDDLIAYGKIRILHIGENRNKSCVTAEAAKKCMNKLAYTPILASFVTVDGVEDFSSHDMKVVTNGEGKEEIEYIEKQIGAITADKASIEHDDSNGKDYLVAKAAIPKTYTHAYDIIKRKKGTTKVSAELLINAFSMEKGSHILSINDCDVMGVTMLGMYEDGTPVEEGMEGANLTLEDFNTKNNSVNYSANDDVTKKIFEMLTSINNKLDNTNPNEGGKKVMNEKLFNELLEKYEKKPEDIEFDYKDKSDEELTALFEATFGKKDPEEKPEDADAKAPASEEPKPAENFDKDKDEPKPEEKPEEKAEEPKEDEKPKDEEPKDDKGEGEASDKAGETKNFDEELRDKLMNKINKLTKAVRVAYPDDWWSVDVYDTYLIEYSYDTRKYFKQSYTETAGEDGEMKYSLADDRVEVFVSFLTAEELEKLKTKDETVKTELENLRQFKADTEKAQNESKAQAVFAKFEDVLGSNDEYKALKENHAEISAEELETKLNALVGKITMFSRETEIKNQKNHSVGFDFGYVPVDKPYGGLFDDIKTK